MIGVSCVFLVVRNWWKFVWLLLVGLMVSGISWVCSLLDFSVVFIVVLSLLRMVFGVFLGVNMLD